MGKRTQFHKPLKKKDNSTGQRRRYMFKMPALPVQKVCTNNVQTNCRETKKNGRKKSAKVPSPSIKLGMDEEGGWTKGSGKRGM